MAVLSIVGLAATPPASAASDSNKKDDVTIAFSGRYGAVTVDELGPCHSVDNVPLRDGTVTGTYTYNSKTDDSNKDKTAGEYRYNTVPYGIEVQTTSFGISNTYKTDPSNVDFAIGILNQPAGDGYGVRSRNNVSNPPVCPVVVGETFTIDIFLGLSDPSGKAVSNDKLSKKAPHLSDWQGGDSLHVDVNGDLGDDFFFEATLTSMSNV